MKTNTKIQTNIKIKPKLKQAVILAGGKSTRTYPLTLTRPKPLLTIANKPLLEHKLDQLDKLVKEVILVVNYKKEMIQQYFGSKYKSLSLKYVVQKEPQGTGHALLCVENYIKDLKAPFLVLGGDDFFIREDIVSCIRFPSALLAQEVEHPEAYGVVIEKKGTPGKNGILHSIEEKPQRPSSHLVNTGCYVFTPSIFAHLHALKPSARNEYELVDAVNTFAHKEKVAVVRAHHWIPITYPWHLLDANEFVLKLLKATNVPKVIKANLKTTIKGTVERGATLKGVVLVGKNTLIKAGAYIEGPVVIGSNCTLGPNCYLRPYTSIGNNCKIGNAVEIKNSILCDHVHVGHLSYVGDSILGEHVNLGAGTITANLRHDDGSVKSMVNGQLVATGRRKLGTILGDGVHTGIHTSLYPGRKLWPNTTTLPGEVVQQDKEV